MNAFFNRFARILLWGLMGMCASVAGEARASTDTPAQSQVAEVVRDVRAAVARDPDLSLHRRAMTEQGLVEEVDFLGALHDRSLVRHGLILDCPAMGVLLRQWLDASESLTRAYLVAEWLEDWGLQCAPEQTTTWRPDDIERLVAAVARAAPHLPKAWNGVGKIFSDRARMQNYLIAINRDGGLVMRDRGCERRAIASNALDFAELEKARNGCRERSTAFSVEDPNDVAMTAHRNQPFTIDFYTPLWGLADLTVSPSDMSAIVRQPNGVAQVRAGFPILFHENPALLPVLKLETEELAAQNGLDGRWASEARRHVLAAEIDLLALRKSSLDLEAHRWMDGAECQRTRMGAIGAISHANDLSVIALAIDHLEQLAVVCPAPYAPALYGLHEAELQQALERARRHSPSAWEPSRQALGEKELPEAVMAGVAHDLDESRLACWRDRVATARRKHLQLPAALARARARCAPVYPETMPQPGKSDDHSPPKSSMSAI